MSITSISDVRSEGITTAMADDAKVTATILSCEATFENACGQWFDERAVTISIDGDNSAVMFLQVPIITIVSLTDLDQNDRVLGVENYRVYNSRNLLQDDRRNPKLAMRNGYRFTIGHRRWEIDGTFGFTESDGSAPAEVKRAMLMMVIEKLLTPIIPGSVPGLPDSGTGYAGPITEEVTDEHKLKYASSAGFESSSKPKYNNDLSSNPYVLGVMNRYRAPMNLRTQADWAFQEYVPQPTSIFNDP